MPTPRGTLLAHTPEHVGAILAAWRAGVSYGALAEQFGLTRSMVAGIITRNKKLGISKHARVVVDAVIAAYEGGDSYSTVARDFGLHTSTVQSIMRNHAPGLVRTRAQAQKVRINPKPVVEGLTLAALGLMRVGPCKACGILLVAKTRENPVKGQTCGLCLDFARRAA